MGCSSNCWLFEVGWAIGLKYTEGFKRFWPTVGTVVAMSSASACSGCDEVVPVGTSYAVWVGVGAVGTAILGIVFSVSPPMLDVYSVWRS